MYTAPSVADFKAFFVRDFKYDADPDIGITDTDITNALTEAGCTINITLFPKQEIYTLGYLLLAAHNLVCSITASSQGLSGQYEGLLTNKSVGSVSVGFQIPEQFLKDAYLSILAKTNYGVRYLQLILPYMVGNIYSVEGRTHA